MSVVFDFNASLNDVAPVSPMSFPDGLMMVKTCVLLMDAILCVFLLSSQFRSSFVSVVFDFSASLNDVAPVSPILFPVDLIMVKTCVLLMNAICVLFLLCSPHR